MSRAIFFCGLTFLCLLVGGCADSFEKPIGIGGGRDDFPASPCACGEPFYVDGRPTA